MRSVKFFGAALTAVAALAVAAPAAALSLTFNVNVTSANGVADFTPFSFQETWTFNPTASSTTGPLFGPPGFETYTVTNRFGGAATVTDSPVSAALKAIAHATGLPPINSSVTLTNRQSYFADNSLQTTNAGGEFVQTAGSNTLLDDGGTPSDPFDDVYDSAFYTRGLSLQVGNYAPPSMDEAGFIAFLQSKGPLNWSETASDQVGGLFEGGTIISSVSESFFGTASLVSGAGAAPEPASWALMILGFGGVGAVLRRRSILGLS